MKFLGFGVMALLGAMGQSAWAANPPKAPEIITVTAPETFSDTELRDFLDKARRAEAISDPLKRCLAYPDPPGSHWSADTVKAYCAYRTDSAMPYDQVKKLIESGHAATFDDYLKGMLEKQLSPAGPPGALDHLYSHYFANASPEVRGLIDSWKRQLPDSAFALAASGVSYKALSAAARGSKVARETPPENFEKMHQLIAFAVTELDKAVTKDPRLTPAYATMIGIGMLESDDGYAARAAMKGLSIQSSNYAIYVAMDKKVQPKWGGSLAQMQGVGVEAQRHAKQNPLLRLLQSSSMAYMANITDCDCGPVPEAGAYRLVLDQIVAADVLTAAANRLDIPGRESLAVVYESEALRLSPWLDSVRARRAGHLAMFEQKEWATAEIETLAKQTSLDTETIGALAHAYVRLGDRRGETAMYARLARRAAGGGEAHP